MIVTGNKRLFIEKNLLKIPPVLPPSKVKKQKIIEILV